MLHKTNIMLLLAGFMVLPQLQAKPRTLTDPTRPGVAVIATTKSEKATNWQLTSIVTGDKPFAIIDDQIKQVGDPIHGVTIKSITADTVELADGRRLTLFQSITEHKG